MLNVGDVVLLEQANEHGQVISGVRTVPVEVHSNGAGKEASNSHPAANLSSPIGTFQCRRGVIGDPSYFPSFVETKSKIIRAVCILPGPVPHTGGIDSLQIIIPQRELLRLSGRPCLWVIARYVYNGAFTCTWCGSVSFFPCLY